jgi:hypothetical protein
MATSRGLSFSTTMWVIDWVHNNTTDSWATSLPTRTSSFSGVDIRLFSVTDNTNGGAATDIDISDFTRWHTELCVWTIFSNELYASASRARDTCAATWTSLDCMNVCTDWDITERQVITRLDIRGWTILDLCTLNYAIWADDVALLAISKVKESDTSRTIWVIFNMCNGGWDSILIVAKEIDYAICALVSASLVASGDATSSVTTAL